MIHNPYSKYRDKELTLNDHLAIDRTILANERTLLAYGRTALALVIVGGSCITFFTALWVTVVGGLFIACGAMVAIRGWQRYRRMKAFVEVALDASTGNKEHPLKDAVETSKKPQDDAPHEPT